MMPHMMGSVCLWRSEVGRASSDDDQTRATQHKQQCPRGWIESCFASTAVNASPLWSGLQNKLGRRDRARNDPPVNTADTETFEQVD